MAATVIRANLTGAELERYLEWNRSICAMAQQAAGYVSHDTFTAKNGDYVTIFNFETDEAAQNWLRSQSIACTSSTNGSPPKRPSR